MLPSWDTLIPLLDSIFPSLLVLKTLVYQYLLSDINQAINFVYLSNARFAKKHPKFLELQRKFIQDVFAYVPEVRARHRILGSDKKLIWNSLYRHTKRRINNDLHLWTFQDEYGKQWVAKRTRKRLAEIEFLWRASHHSNILCPTWIEIDSGINYIQLITAKCDLSLFEWTRNIVLIGRPSKEFLYSSISLARTLFRGIVSALALIHKLGYVHCDIKPENILLNVMKAKYEISQFAQKNESFFIPYDALRAPNHWEVFVSDFDLLQPIGTRKICGTRQFLAPDILRNMSSYVIDPACDMWSLGCTLLEFFSGNSIFGKEATTLAFECCDEKFFDQHYVPKEDTLRDFITQCLITDPILRITSSNALEHPFFARA